ncbi:hypothetical protein IJH46_02210 [Candidatus Saccharibacteria bacterium]|nr:hypothetical protein [Candidatus Saccharibacteria bacterium]
MTTKTIFPYVWVWSARIDNYSGEVRVRLTERKKDESMHEADYVEFRYSAETVVSYLKSHCAHNKFREVNYEGEQAREFYRLRDVCEREVMHHRDSLIFRGEITPFYSEMVENMARIYMFIKVARSSGGYDNFYGGGDYHHPGFNFQQWLLDHSGQ